MQAQGTGKTASRILDVAEKLVQTRGFNAFSYADVADEVKVRKASLHHHFATKSDLVENLVTRYEQRFLAALEVIETSPESVADKLERYIEIYAGVLRKNRMCLCGILAAEYTTLPKGVRERVTKFFEANETWLAALLEKGHKTGELIYTGSPLEIAHFVVSTLEGAMLVARAQKDHVRFNKSAARLVEFLTR